MGEGRKGREEGKREGVRKEKWERHITAGYIDTSSSLQCREVVQRVSLLMNVVTVYQFTDGIQVCCVQDKVRIEAAGLK